MDDVRAEVNEQLVDELSGRVDELDRRLRALLELLKEERVCKALGISLQRLDRADERPSMYPGIRHSNLRNKRVREQQERAVIKRLANVPPERLRELLGEG